MKNTYLLLAALAAVATSRADVSPAFIFQDHAVLQQGRPVPVWGGAEPGEKITVTYARGGFSKDVAVTAGPDGRWRAELPALPASAEAATLAFAGKNTVVRSDILVGEVWLASGQSNMEWALSWGDRVVNAKAEIASADFPLIRQFKVKSAASDEPADSAPGDWKVCSPANVRGFSAVAYFFARDIHGAIRMPVGIINASWGGSLIEPFMTPDSLAGDPNGPAVIAKWKALTANYPEAKARYDRELVEWTRGKAAADKAGEKFTAQKPTPPPGPGHQATPSGSYNAMIHPVESYALRGVIWYQGESNAGRHVEYRTFFPSLIAGWRAAFNQPDMPFYWVQLAGWGANGDADGTGFAWLRDAQDRTLSVPGTGQAVAIDVGDRDNIHPGRKQEVGNRLARLALHRTYGRREVADSGPVFAGLELKANDNPALIRVRFTQVAGGLVNRNDDDPAAVYGFEVAGEDKIFRHAIARVDDAAKGSVLVTAPDGIAAPVHVRYAWRNYPQCTLANAEGLPAAPFRTDQ